MRKVWFRSSDRKLVGNLLTPDSDKKLPMVIFRHGGGKKKMKERYEGWQKYLGEKGIGSLAFDFTGVGESEGSFEDGSLKQRMKDGMAAFEHVPLFVQ